MRQNSSAHFVKRPSTIFCAIFSGLPKVCALATSRSFSTTSAGVAASDRYCGRIATTCIASCAAALLASSPSAPGPNATTLTIRPASVTPGAAVCTYVPTVPGVGSHSARLRRTFSRVLAANPVTPSATVPPEESVAPSTISSGNSTAPVKPLAPGGGPAAAAALAAPRASATNASLRAEKSVSTFTSTSAAPPSPRANATSPSAATREPFFAAAASPRLRKPSNASSRS
mmetsp:Transcript_13564/g.44683  ORF Transcript_13564/g.44683 Transcript_13564/m.44683 type:complete len:230 (+) Transcript_13564:357-1046(+)